MISLTVRTFKENLTFSHQKFKSANMLIFSHKKTLPSVKFININDLNIRLYKCSQKRCVNVYLFVYNNWFWS